MAESRPIGTTHGPQGRLLCRHQLTRHPPIRCRRLLRDSCANPAPQYMAAVNALLALACACRLGGGCAE